MNKTTETQETVVKPYEFRKLDATDIFPISTIISKIGINQFTDSFGKDNIKALIASVSGDTGSAPIVGYAVALDVANVVFSNIGKCEKDIYNLLANTSNLSVEEVKALGFAEFAGMVIDFIKKDEFKDFIKVVSGLFK